MSVQKNRTSVKISLVHTEILIVFLSSWTVTF